MAEEPLQVSSLWAYDADLAEKIEEQEHKVGRLCAVWGPGPRFSAKCSGSKTPAHLPMERSATQLGIFHQRFLIFADFATAVLQPRLSAVHFCQASRTTPAAAPMSQRLHARGWRLALLTFSTLGVVYGDIGERELLDS